MPPPRILRSTFVVFALSILGCGSGETTDSDVPSVPAQDPAEAGPDARFSALEERLRSATDLSMDFHVTATGAIEVSLEGSLRVLDGDGISLSAEGVFADSPVTVELHVDEEIMRMMTGADTMTSARPPFVQDAIAIGFMRMGILHNLARLTSGAGPDHAEGGASTWVEAHTFRATADDANGVEFDLRVAGEPSGSATLVIDSSGTPVRRTQDTEFPTGIMHVVERYSNVVIDP